MGKNKKGKGGSNAKSGATTMRDNADIISSDTAVGSLDTLGQSYQYGTPSNPSLEVDEVAAVEDVVEDAGVQQQIQAENSSAETTNKEVHNSGLLLVEETSASTESTVGSQTEATEVAVASGGESNNGYEENGGTASQLIAEEVQLTIDVKGCFSSEATEGTTSASSEERSSVVEKTEEGSQPQEAIQESINITATEESTSMEETEETNLLSSSPAICQSNPSRTNEGEQSEKQTGAETIVDASHSVSKGKDERGSDSSNATTEVVFEGTPLVAESTQVPPLEPQEEASFFTCLSVFKFW